MEAIKKVIVGLLHLCAIGALIALMCMIPLAIGFLGSGRLPEVLGSRVAPEDPLPAPRPDRRSAVQMAIDGVRKTLKILPRET